MLQRAATKPLHRLQIRLDSSLECPEDRNAVYHVPLGFRLLFYPPDLSALSCLYGVVLSRRLDWMLMKTFRKAFERVEGTLGVDRD